MNSCGWNYITPGLIFHQETLWNYIFLCCRSTPSSSSCVVCLVNMLSDKDHSSPSAPSSHTHTHTHTHTPQSLRHFQWQQLTACGNWEACFGDRIWNIVRGYTLLLTASRQIRNDRLSHCKHESWGVRRFKRNVVPSWSCWLTPSRQRGG